MEEILWKITSTGTNITVFGFNGMKIIEYLFP